MSAIIYVNIIFKVCLVIVVVPKTEQLWQEGNSPWKFPLLYGQYCIVYWSTALQLKDIYNKYRHVTIHIHTIHIYIINRDMNIVANTANKCRNLQIPMDHQKKSILLFKIVIIICISYFKTYMYEVRFYMFIIHYITK